MALACFWRMALLVAVLMRLTDRKSHGEAEWKSRGGCDQPLRKNRESESQVDPECGVELPV